MKHFNITPNIIMPFRSRYRSLLLRVTRARRYTTRNSVRTAWGTVLTYGMTAMHKVQQLQPLRMGQEPEYKVMKVTDDGQLRLPKEVQRLWGRHVIVMENEQGKVVLDPIKVEG